MNTRNLKKTYFKRMVNNAACEVARVMGAQMPKMSKGNWDEPYDYSVYAEDYKRYLETEECQMEIERIAVLKYQRAKALAYRQMMGIRSFDSMVRNMRYNWFAVVTNWEMVG